MPAVGIVVLGLRFAPVGKCVLQCGVIDGRAGPGLANSKVCPLERLRRRDYRANTVVPLIDTARVTAHTPWKKRKLGVHTFQKIFLLLLMTPSANVPHIPKSGRNC